MVKTGITRRIDELGRLVIPKEIRRNLKIKDNEEIEITVIDNQIILKKYDYLKKDNVINTLINLLRKKIGLSILFTSRDKVVDYSLINNEKLDNNVLTIELMNIIENRKDRYNYRNNGILYNISPLIINGDLYGSLIAYGDKEINDNEIEHLIFSKMFLENYLE